MEIPYLVILGVYGLVLLIMAVLSAFNIYHVIRYGMNTVTTTVMSALYVAFMVVIVGATFVTLRNVDWTSTFVIDIPVPTVTP